MRIANFFRTKLGSLVAIIGITGLSVASTIATYETIHMWKNKEYLNELNQKLLTRAELAADYAIITLNETAEAGFTTCSDVSMGGLAETIFTKSNIKDIAILDTKGNSVCSVISGRRATFPIDISLKKRFPTSNDRINFVEVGTGSDGVIGITWQFTDFGLMALINIDTLLFDIFPMDWRDNSIATIGFDKNASIGSHDSTMHAGLVNNPDTEIISYQAQSSRYPLNAELAVGLEQLIMHNREDENFFIAGGGILGLLFGFLIAQLLARPENPITEIKRGIDANEFVPFVQPLFDLKDLKIIGGEALMRWRKPDGSIVPPSQFITLAEDSGLIVPMTRSIIKQTLKHVDDILVRDRSLKVSFNVTPQDLISDGFIIDLVSIVSDSRVNPDQIVLEITERQEIKDGHKAAGVIQSLKSLGYRIALDDTGTGHNGLSYIQDLNADIMKIDKKFVDFISDDGGTEIVQMLVQLAKRMKMQTIAEGIETEDQARILNKLGVDQGQGYYVAKPLEPEEFCMQVRKQALK